MSRLAHSSDKMMELIEINSVIAETHGPERFELLNLADNQKYVTSRLEDEGLLDEYLTWIYFNTK